jgi:hypothetical protein
MPIRGHRSVPDRAAGPPRSALPSGDPSLYADGVTDPIVSLDLDRVAVEPGGQASVTIKITNPGAIVEGYRVEVIGEGVSDWGEALPPEISIYPQQDASAVIVFSPPGGTGAPGGTWPFGIRVRSTEDADASAVVEGDLEIGKVFGLQAKLLPVNSSGRWRGRHVVQLSNWGNAPAKLTLTATNQDEALGFLIRPDVVELALGGEGRAMVWVKTKTPKLRGTTTRIPFTVTGEQVDAPAPQGPAAPYGGTPDRPSVDGAFNQKPILTAGAVMALALVLLALGGGIAWALTRPPPAQATFQELGPPEPPGEVAVEPIGSDSVRVRWKAVPDVSGYRVVQVLPDDSQTGSVDVPGTDTAKTVGELTPATNVCFAVQALRGELSSPFSGKACADTPAAQSTVTPSPSGPPESSAPPSAPPSGGAASSAGGSAGGAGGGAGGGGGQPSTSTSGEPTVSPSTPGQPSTGGDTVPNAGFKGKWFAIGFWPVQGTVYDEAEKLAELKALDDRAGLVNSTVYPTMVPRLQMESWILYLGPFDTQAEANTACVTVRKVHPDCRAVQLDP